MQGNEVITEAKGFKYIKGHSHVYYGSKWLRFFVVSHEIYQPYAGNANVYFPLASLIKKKKQNKTKKQGNLPS